jgi:hypothetical protein
LRSRRDGSCYNSRMIKFYTAIRDTEDKRQRISIAMETWQRRIELAERTDLDEQDGAGERGQTYGSGCQKAPAKTC